MSANSDLEDAKAALRVQAATIAEQATKITNLEAQLAKLTHLLGQSLGQLAQASV